VESSLQPTERPTFSIVVPSYNRKERLARALNHLSQQTYPPELLEVVVVLDGCTDGSEAMLEQLRPSFPFKLQIISQAQSGPSAARNTGVKATRGEYILFVDDDVMVIPQLIMEHWQSHRHNPRLVVVGSMSKPVDYQGSTWTNWEQYILEEQYKDILSGKYAMSHRQFYTGNCSLKREWIIQAGLFDEDFKRYEDVELACRLQALGLQFEFNPKAIGYHYVERSFESWTKTHYLYGRYAVKLEREKHVKGWIEMSQKEFKGRNWITQFLSVRLFNHSRAQKVVAWGLLQSALLATLLKQERVGYKAMSCTANILYWQGFKEELNLKVPTGETNK